MQTIQRLVLERLFQAFGKEHKVTAPTPKSVKALMTLDNMPLTTNPQTSYNFYVHTVEL